MGLYKQNTNMESDIGLINVSKRNFSNFKITVAHYYNDKTTSLYLMVINCLIYIIIVFISNYQYHHCYYWHCRLFIYFI